MVKKKSNMTDEQAGFFKGKTFTLKGHMMFPELFKPVMTQYKPNPIYQMEFVLDGDDAKTTEAVRGIENNVSMYKETFYGDKTLAQWHSPVKDYETHRNSEGEKAHARLKGKKWLKPWSHEKYPPSIFDVDKEKVTDPAELVNGRKCLLHVGLYPYDTGTNKGVGLRFIAVVVLTGREDMGEQVDPDTAFAGFESEFKQSEQGREVINEIDI